MRLTRKPPPQKGKGAPAERPKDWFDHVAGYSGAVAKVCLAAFVVSLGYIIYAVYGGYVSAQQLDARKLSNIAIMGKLLAAAGIIGTTAFALATMGEVAYVVAAGFLGLGLIFGTPVLIISKLQDPNNLAALEISTWTRNAGFGMCAVALLRILYHIGYTIKMGPKARAKALEEEEDQLGPKKVKRTRGIWSACWNLPYCHDTIREVCPAFKERKSCWRIRRGCNCDPMLVESLIRAGAARMGKGQDKVAAQQQQTQDEYLRDALGAGRGAGPRPPDARTMECTKCPIYGEHQRQKFRIANPIAIMATVALLVVSYPITKQAYFATVEGLASIAARFTMTETIDPGRWFNYLNTPAVQIFFFAIVTIFLLAYILKVVEWAIFVRKW